MAALSPRIPGLLDQLAKVLPAGRHFGVHHVSTPPTRTDALYSAPPDERPDKTYCESHFLALSVDSLAPQARPPEAAALVSPRSDTASPVLVFAIEVLIFTTAYTTTIFVSKADSTGYLHLLKLPKGSPSLIREVSATFVSYLVAHRRRKGISTIATLFARAQGQYLFPGSVENSGKHVLDDRGLVKWWCKVLNTVLEAQHVTAGQDSWATVEGYLVVPGLDTYETKAFLPRTLQSAEKWTMGHPLEKISHYTKEYDWVPPRCLIPRYPDDPKSRFRDELDEEVGKWKQTTGAWRSIRTLDEFWEMMQFRQECSSGRLTGFMWVVLDPEDDSLAKDGGREGSISAPSSALIKPSASFDANSPAEPPSTPTSRRTLPLAITPRSAPRKLNSPQSSKSTPSKGLVQERKKKTRKLTGRIVPRQPHAKTQQRNYLLDRPASTAYYHWPPEGRGQKLVDESDYKRCTELLLRLDFATLEKATNSTARWTSEVGMGQPWGARINGKRELSIAAPPSSNWGQAGTALVVNNLSGLVKRKRVDAQPVANGNDTTEPRPKVTVLGAGLVRKKRKEADAAA